MILIDVWDGSGEDARTRVRDYCELWGIDATVLLDEDGSYAKRLGVRGVPTNILVDADGIVRDFGAGNPDELQAKIDALRDPA